MKKNLVVSSQNSVVSIFKKILVALFFTLLTTDYCLLTTAFSADKSWTAQGDQENWFDGANWLPAGAPAQQDTVKVDLKDASVDLGQNFNVKSLTLGGKKTSRANVSNFVTGSIAPSAPTDEALLLRKDGTLVMKGSSGKVTLKGTYKDSEEDIPEEPGFMLYVK